MPKLMEKRMSVGKSRNDLAKSVGAKTELITQFEHYRCLPTPPMMDLLTKELNCAVTDLYEPCEIDLLGAENRRTNKNKPSVSDVYKLTADLPPEARALLKEALKACGYRSVTDWANRCYRNLIKRYERKKEKASHGSRQASDVRPKSNNGNS